MPHRPEIPHADSRSFSLTSKFDLFKKHLLSIQGEVSSSEYDQSGISGSIKVDLDPTNKKLMLVATDTAALVSNEREIATQRLSGCAAIFIEGPGITYLAHMTPNSNLGYYYYRFNNPQELVKMNVGRLLEPLSKSTDPKQCRALIIVNQGDNNGGHYDQQVLTKAWSQLRDQLSEAGLGEVTVADPLPLDETSLYYNPDQPETISAVGLIEPGSAQKKQITLSKSGKITASEELHF